MSAPYKCKACGLGSSHSGKGMLFGFMWKCPGCGCRETVAVDHQPKFKVGDRVVTNHGKRIFGRVRGLHGNTFLLDRDSVRGMSFKPGEAAEFYFDPKCWELWRPKPGDWVDIDVASYQGAPNQVAHFSGTRLHGTGKVVYVDPLDGGTVVVCVDGRHQEFSTCFLTPVLDPNRVLKKSSCRQCFPLLHPHACCPVCKGPWDRAVGSYPAAETGKRCTCCGALKPAQFCPPTRCSICDTPGFKCEHLRPDTGRCPICKSPVRCEHVDGADLDPWSGVRALADLQTKLAKVISELAETKSKLADTKQELAFSRATENALLEANKQMSRDTGPLRKEAAELLSQNKRLGQQVRELGNLVDARRSGVAKTAIVKALQDCYNTQPMPLLFFVVNNEPMMGMLEEFTTVFRENNELDWNKATLKVTLLHRGFPVSKTFNIVDIDYLAPLGKVTDIVSN